MKKLLFSLMTLALVSCAQTTTESPDSARGPASVGTQKTEKLWGKTVRNDEVDFLDEVENAPSVKY
tara:strand:+ start:282 stop:479 length:198 start_codon:yes stop_codon:yes gene_type:complete